MPAPAGAAPVTLLEAIRQTPLGVIHQVLPETICQTHPVAVHLKGHPVATPLKDHLVATHLRGHPVAIHLKGHPVATPLKDHPEAPPLEATHLRGHLAGATLLPSGGKARPDRQDCLARREALVLASPHLSQSITCNHSRHQHHPGSRSPPQRISRGNRGRPRSL